MKIYYRISESSNDSHINQRQWQEKLPYATKQACLLNVIKRFPNSEIYIFVDNISNETWKWINSLQDIKLVQKINAGSDARSMRYLLEEAIRIEDPNEIILFQEDDYIYLPDSEEKIIEALEYGDYVTGYLHPDKFIHPSKGGNPFTPKDNFSELTQVIKSKDHFWMITNSTTNTFATKVGTIKKDIDTWMWGTSDLINTRDFEIFMKLKERNRLVLQPIPSLSTHCLKNHEAPVIGLNINSWEDGLK
jgi:hypothetical protein